MCSFTWLSQRLPSALVLDTLHCLFATVIPTLTSCWLFTACCQSITRMSLLVGSNLEAFEQVIFSPSSLNQFRPPGRFQPLLLFHLISLVTSLSPWLASFSLPRPLILEGLGLRTWDLISLCACLPLVSFSLHLLASIIVHTLCFSDLCL